MTKRSELTGKTFGKLLVLGLSEVSRNGHTRWKVECSCGITKTVLGTHLISGKTKTCGDCSKHRRNWKGFGDIPMSYFNSLKRGSNGSKGRNAIEFDISIEYIWNLFLKQNKRCALSYIELSFQSKTASLDRIDSSKGYVEGNVQWLHKDVNMMKRHYDQNYFISLCHKITDATRVKSNSIII